MANRGARAEYSVAAEVDEFREDSDPVYIRMTAYVERESQKGIFIGKEGRTIRKIGSTTRKKIETLLGLKVYLDLWVKVKPKWRKNDYALRQFGYSTTRRKKKR